MDKEYFSAYRIDDKSYVSFIKREIHNMLLLAGFNAARAGEVDIIVSELTSNLTKYAGHGELLYRISHLNKDPVFEIICIDSGNGITNIEKMMKDGNSSSNTLGHGLGAISRLSDVFQIYSVKGWGTVQYTKKSLHPTDIMARTDVFEHGTIQVCCPGEHICGDGFYVKESLKGLQVFVGDGLGHGVKAHEAVSEAITIFKNSHETNPVEILREMHAGVRKTRGLVGTIASLDYRTKKWNVCGIGNISTRIYNGLECRNYTPYNGIIGHNIPRTINNTISDMEEHQTLIMHSDGLRTRWNISDFPALLKYDPKTIAAVLYKHNARGNDDMTAFVGKLKLQ